MRFVAVNSAQTQAAAVVFRTRDWLVRQRTQAINALRGHLAEFGLIAARGPVHTSKLIAAIEDPASDLPQAARGILAVLVEQLRSLDERIAVLDREIARHATENPVARRLMTIPGIGAVTAAARMALAPPADTFRRGRDFAAWLGLTPVQRSSGGKERLGKTSKMGERSLRRLLIIGASAVARWAARKGVPAGSGLGRMLARKPPMLVRVALANKMARIVWALLAKGGVTEFSAVLKQAEAAGTTCMPHSPYFGPGYWATLQLLAVAPGQPLLERLYVEPNAMPGVDTPLPDRGTTVIPTLPGIGFEPDWEVFGRFGKGACSDPQ